MSIRCRSAAFRASFSFTPGAASFIWGPSSWNRTRRPGRSGRGPAAAPPAPGSRARSGHRAGGPGIQPLAPGEHDVFGVLEGDPPVLAVPAGQVRPDGVALGQL